MAHRSSDTRPDGQSLFPARWEDVPAPLNAIGQISAECGVQPTPMTQGQWAPTPGGTYEIQNALVDRKQRVGAWSQTTAIGVAPGWNMFADCTNLPNDPRAAGVLWKVRHVETNTEMIWGDNLGPHNFQSYSLNSSLSVPKPVYIWNNATHKNYKTGGILNEVGLPPKLFFTTVPNVDLEVCFCWITNNGESAPSPVGILPKSNDARIPDAQRESVVTKRNLMTVERTPWGALGYHLYVRRVGTTEWHRQPYKLGMMGINTNLTPDDYVWPLNNNRPVLYQFREDTPGLLNTPTPQSWLTDAQVMMKYTVGDCIIDTPQVIFCPFVDEYEGRYGMQQSTFEAPANVVALTGVPTTITYNDYAKLPYVGSETVHKFEPRPRQISFAEGVTVKHGGKVQGFDHATFFPAVLVQGRSKFVGLIIDGSHPTLKTFSAGLQFRDYSGGQSMSCVYDGLVISLQVDPEWQTKAIEVSWECAGNNGHTASELLFNDCNLNACVPVWLENNQSANIRFTGRNFISGFSKDRRCPTFWLDLPCEVNFEGALYCQAGGTLFSLGWSPTVNVERIFVDQPVVSLIDCNHYQPGRVSFLKGKWNAFTPQPSGPNNSAQPGDPAPNFLRVFNSTYLMPVHVDGLTVQPNTTEGAAAVSIAPFRVSLAVERSNLLDVMTLNEPLASQFDAVSPWKNVLKDSGYVVVIPSYDLTVPAYTLTTPQTRTQNGDVIPPMTINVPAKTVKTPVKTVVQQSLDGTTKNVKRKSWL